MKELKGFEKVFIKAGETKNIIMSVKYEDLAYWSETGHRWEVDPGQYQIQIGSSSKEIKQQILINKK